MQLLACPARHVSICRTSIHATRKFTCAERALLFGVGLLWAWALVRARRLSVRGEGVGPKLARDRIRSGVDSLSRTKILLSAPTRHAHNKTLASATKARDSHQTDAYKGLGKPGFFCASSSRTKLRTSIYVHAFPFGVSPVGIPATRLLSYLLSLEEIESGSPQLFYNSIDQKPNSLKVG